MKIMKNKIIIFVVLCLLLVFGLVFIRPVSGATELLFSTLSVKSKVGETFDLDISIDPNGEMNFTTIVELKYPFDLLEVVEFSFAPGLVPVNQSGYDDIDNRRGEIIKTAGFPGGVKTKQKFGTVKFRTKKDGQGTIEVGSNTIALDENNQDVFSRAFPEATIISGKVVEEIDPEKVFGINFTVNSTKFEDISELVSTVNVKNQTMVEAPIYIEHIIYDTKEAIRFREENYLVVEDTEVLRKTYENLDLPVGNYSLILKTLYSDDVIKEYERAFAIIEGEEKRTFNWSHAMYVVGGALFVFFVFLHFFKKKVYKKNDKV